MTSFMGGLDLPPTLPMMMMRSKKGTYVELDECDSTS
jgi:hypothetical protein